MPPRWFLCVLHPKKEFILGRERRRIIDLDISGRRFHGIKAGKYTVRLTYGTLDDAAVPVYRGKLENIYAINLIEAIVEKKLVGEERRRLLKHLIRTRIPLLRVKAYKIYGNLTTPIQILNFWKDEKEKMKAWIEMKERKLIHPNVLWFVPVPREKILDILTGAIGIPEIIQNHITSLEEVSISYRSTLRRSMVKLSDLLSRLIPLMRDIVDSVCDPFYVVGAIFTDRAKRISGLGISQLTEKGTIEGYKEAVKQIFKHKKEIDEIFKAAPTPEEIRKTEKTTKEIKEIKSILEGLKSTVEEIKKVTK